MSKFIVIKRICVFIPFKLNGMINYAFPLV